MNVGIETIEKVLVAGPSLLMSGAAHMNLSIVISNQLYSKRKFIRNMGVILADDTVTGRLTRDWCEKTGTPVWGHRAFDGCNAKLNEMFYSDRARQLIVDRNNAMMNDRRLFDAVLFIQSNETHQFIEGLRKHKNNVGITRICL